MVRTLNTIGSSKWVVLDRKSIPVVGCNRESDTLHYSQYQAVLEPEVESGP